MPHESLHPYSDLKARTDGMIFISYSRSDSDFARGLYKRLAELSFRLWRDRSEMEAGENWWAQIREAIESSETMVLVLSPAALASDVVRKEWRHARQVGTRVIPVIAADVDFGSAPAWMARKDWLDFRSRAPESDIIWAKFITLLNTPYQPRRLPFMVEPLSENFVERPAETEALVKHLLEARREEAIAITTALKGAGGFGKTTLARAVCHDERIQEAFDDGILWVQLGERPRHLLGHVLDLIEVLLGTRPGFNMLDAAKSRLAELLDDRHILMVIDDVWSPADLQPFLHGKCVRLITTRNSETLPDNTRKVNVDAMRAGEAIELLGKGLPAGEAEARARLVKRLGEWPLLISLANGMLRDQLEYGDSLPEALAFINASLDELGLTAFDDPDDQRSRERAVKATIEASLKRLGGNEPERYSDLSLFPDDVDVPLAAVERLWQATAGLGPVMTRKLCDRLAKLSLLQLFDLSARAIRLHDVTRAYLRERREGLPALNDLFLKSYSVVNWPELPGDELYLWNFLTYHLHEARRHEDLKALFADQRWMRSRLAHDGYIYDGYVADLSLAWESAAHPHALAQIAARAEPSSLPSCLRYALIRTSVNSIASNYPPKLIGRALKAGLWTPRRALSTAARMLSPTQKAETYTALLASGALGEQERAEALALALASAQDVDYAGYRAEKLTELAEEVEGSQKVELLREALEAAALVESPGVRSSNLAALVPKLDLSLLPRVLELAEHIPHGHDRVKVLVQVADRLEGQEQAAVLATAFDAALSVEDDFWRCLSLEEVFAHLNGQLLERAWDALSSLKNEYLLARALIPLCRWLEGDRKKETREAALEVTLGVQKSLARADMLGRLVPAFEGDERAAVLKHAYEAARRIEKENLPVDAYAELAYLMEGDEKRRLLELALDETEAVDRGLHRRNALGKLASHLSGDLLERALALALDIEYDDELIEAVAELAGKLEGEHKTLATERALRAIRSGGDDHRRVELFSRIVPYLDDSVIEEALRAALTFGDETLVVEALANLAGCLKDERRLALVEQILASLSDDQNDWAKQSALVALAPRTDEKLLARAREQALTLRDEGAKHAAVIGLTEESRKRDPDYSWEPALALVISSEDDYWRASSLQTLALKVDDYLLPRILEAIIQIEDEKQHSWALTSLVERLRESPLLERVLEESLKITDEEVLGTLLSDMAQYLEGDLLLKAYEAAGGLTDEDARWRALIRMAPRLPMRQRGQLLSASRTAKDSLHRLSLLVAVAPRLKEEGHDEELARLPDEILGLEFAERWADPEVVRAGLLLDLIESLERPPSEKAVSGVLGCAESMFKVNRAAALIRLLPHLEGERRERVIADALNTALRINLNEREGWAHMDEFVRVFNGLAPHVSGESLISHLETYPSPEALPREYDRVRAEVFKRYPDKFEGESLRPAIELANAIASADDRAVALAGLLQVCGDKPALTEGIRRALAAHMLALKDQEREHVLKLCATESLFGDPVFSEETVAEMTEQIMDICYGWQWI